MVIVQISIKQLQCGVIDLFIRSNIGFVTKPNDDNFSNLIARKRIVNNQNTILSYTQGHQWNIFGTTAILKSDNGLDEAFEWLSSALGPEYAGSFQKGICFIQRDASKTKAKEK